MVSHPTCVVSLAGERCTTAAEDVGRTASSGSWRRWPGRRCHRRTGRRQGGGRACRPWSVSTLVVLVSDLRGVRKGLGHAAAAIGREGAGCLDGVLEWLEGLELGGSSGRARCRQPQERDRRAAAASARGSSGRRGNSVEPRRPARAATARARGSGSRREQRHAGARASFLLPDPATAAARCSSPPSPAPLWRGRPWSARATRAATAWWGRTTRPDWRRRRTRAAAGGRGRWRTRATGRIREGWSGSGGSSSSPSATARCRRLPARRSARSGGPVAGFAGARRGAAGSQPGQQTAARGSGGRTWRLEAEAGAGPGSGVGGRRAGLRVCGRGGFFLVGAKRGGGAMG